MVGRNSGLRILLGIIIVALFLAILAPWAMAQGLQEEQSWTLEEQTRVEINDVGDAHIVDTLTYDPTWFDQYSYIFEENPNLLSRRYRSDTNVGEVENLNTDINNSKSTVTVTFDTPGLAYNMGDNWDIYGYSNYQLSSKDQNEVVLEDSWVLNNEYTLFDDIPVDNTVTFDLPGNATNANLDKGTGTVKYDLPYTKGQKQGFLAENKTLFTIVFALLMILSLLLFLYAITRKTTVAMVPAGIVGPAPGAPMGVPPQAPGVAAGPPPPTPPTPEVTVGEQPTAPGISSEPSAETPVGPKFCKQCGEARTSPDSKFCKNCGAPFE
jgi:type II secretory pathway pseudopilin PulG